MSDVAVQASVLTPNEISRRIQSEAARSRDRYRARDEDRSGSGESELSRRSRVLAFEDLV